MIGILKNLSTKLHQQVNKSISNIKYLSQALQHDLWLNRCALCSSEAETTPCLCQQCRSDIEHQGITCTQCYEPVDIPDQALCPECILNPPSFDLTYCFALYQFPSSKLVQYLKFNSHRYLAKTMAQCMAGPMQNIYGRFNQSITAHRGIALVYVPLHKDKLKLRGFNQSESIAMHLSKALSLPILENYLEKTHNTTTQTQLNRRKRLSNLQGALRIRDKNQLAPKHVILIDDVMTTGATAEAASKLLKDHGVERVDVCCFARTPKERTL